MGGLIRHVHNWVAVQEECVNLHLVVETEGFGADGEFEGPRFGFCHLANVPFFSNALQRCFCPFA